MFRKIKDLFAKEEQSPIEIGLLGVPGWLDAEMAKIREYEETKVSGSRQQVMTAITELKKIVPDLGSGEHAETGFVKLEKIAENSLPLFKKSMMSSLSRSFPEKTEDFYHAVAECLKVCIKSTQGPGRYLVRVFPEEMKLIQAEVSRLGKEVNAMNPVFAESKEKRNSLEKIRTIHHSLVRMNREHADAIKNLPHRIDESAKLGGEQEELSRQVINTGNDPRFTLYSDLTRKEEELLQHHERLTGEMSVLSGMVIHVMRRAEKIAHKDHNDVLGKKIHVLIETLSKSQMPSPDEFLPMVSGILPQVIDMVESDEITLKNGEEQLIFASASVLPSRFEDLYLEIGELNMQIGDVRDEIENDTFIREKEAVEKRYKQKKSEYHENERNISDIRHKIEMTVREIPGLVHQLEEHMSSYLGETVRISAADAVQKDSTFEP